MYTSCLLPKKRGSLWKRMAFHEFSRVRKKYVSQKCGTNIFSHATWSKLFTKFHQEFKSCENPLRCIAQQHAMPKRSPFTSRLITCLGQHGLSLEFQIFQRSIITPEKRTRDIFYSFKDEIFEYKFNLSEKY